MQIRKCRHGNFVVDYDDTVQCYSLDCYGEYLEKEIDFVLPYLNKSSVVVDIGAGVGYFAVALANKVKKVIAFEPEKRSFKLLKENISVNKTKNIIPFQKAITTFKGMVAIPELTGRCDFGKISLEEVCPRGPIVEMETVDTLNFPVLLLNSKIDLIKIDVNGMEIDVLEGSYETLEKYKPYLLIKSQDENIAHWLEENDYTYKTFSCPYYTDDNYMRYFIDNFKKSEHFYFATHKMVNVKRDKYLKGQGLIISPKDAPYTSPNPAVYWNSAVRDAVTLKGLDKSNFDFVFAEECINEIFDYRTALKSWCKVLKPGGYLVVAVENSSDENVNPSCRGKWQAFSVEPKGIPQCISVRKDLNPMLREHKVCMIDLWVENNMIYFAARKKTCLQGKQ